MKQKIDKELISLYKNLLISKLKEYDDWHKYEHNIKKSVTYICYPIKTNDKVHFDLDGDTNVIELIINDATIYEFKPIRNLMLHHILRFKSGLKDIEHNRRVKKKEELMKNALPLDYQRSVKINKIINKI
jgi:hypothetical protein